MHTKSNIEFALFIKFVISHEQRQIGHAFVRHSFIVFRRYKYNQLAKWVPQVTKHPVRKIRFLLDIGSSVNDYESKREDDGFEW